MGTHLRERDVTCHMGSHSVTCHPSDPTQVNAPRLTDHGSSRQRTVPYVVHSTIGYHSNSWPSCNVSDAMLGGMFNCVRIE